MIGIRERSRLCERRQTCESSRFHSSRRFVNELAAFRAL